jgi:acetate kinase
MSGTCILVINAGSSSIKLDVFIANPTTQESEKFLTAALNGIGLPKGKFSYKHAQSDKQTIEIEASDFDAAIAVITDWLNESKLLGSITAIGHRIVHGGAAYTAPVIIDERFIAYLRTSMNLDPEHIPAELALITSLQELLPDTPQIACFDTAFFAELPRIAQLLTIPKKYQLVGMRRYGFHGLSYTYLSETFGAIAGEDARKGRVIYAHLGSGSSLAAMKDGKPIDTTMGFTPASGIIMSTRAGDIDPGISRYLELQHGLTPDQYSHMINFESGLLGVSGISADMYTLIQKEETEPTASEAVQLFVYQTQKTIGAFSAVLGGLDSLVFSGGIGEQSSILRNRICSGLAFLGVSLNSAQNDNHEFLISDSQSKVGVHVIPTDESAVILKQVIQTIQANIQKGI